MKPIAKKNFRCKTTKNNIEKVYGFTTRKVLLDVSNQCVKFKFQKVIFQSQHFLSIIYFFTQSILLRGIKLLYREKIAIDLIYEIFIIRHTRVNAEINNFSMSLLIQSREEKRKNYSLTWK